MNNNAFSGLISRLKVPVLLLVMTLIIGVSGYHIIYPNKPFTHLLYMTSITLSTVGYGDLLGLENNIIGLLYTMVLMLMGLGLVVYSASTITAFIVEGKLEKIFLIQRILRRVSKMKNHYIVCGAGTTGKHVINELILEQHPVVIVDQNEDLLDQYQQTNPSSLIIIGDATSEEVLKKANIANAKGIAITLSNDKENLYLTLTARLMSPKIQIVSRAIDLDLKEKLLKAGANYVVSPNFIGGMRMASEILRPNVVSFLDKMLRGKDKSIRVGEAIISEGSHWIGKTLKDLNLHEQCGVNVLALGSKEKDEYKYNPSLELKLQKEDVLLFISNIDQQKKVEAYLS